MVVTHRGSATADGHSCRLCRERPAQRRPAFAGMCCRCHTMSERRNLCITCCKNTRRRPVKNYANMRVRCFEKCHIHFECRRCKSQKRQLSPYILARKFKDADDLCLDCYQLAKAKNVCFRCFQHPRDRRRGSKSLGTLCKQASSSSVGAYLLFGASSTSLASILERAQAAVWRGIVDGSSHRATRSDAWHALSSALRR